MLSYHQAQMIFQFGHPEGWGRVLDLPTQTDKKGLGFMTGRNKSISTPLKTQDIPSPIQFVSGGVIHEEVDAVNEDGDSDCEMDKWVRPTVQVEKLVNWFAEDVIEVTLFEEQFSCFTCYHALIHMSCLRCSGCAVRLRCFSLQIYHQ